MENKKIKFNLEGKELELRSEVVDWVKDTRTFPGIRPLLEASKRLDYYSANGQSDVNTYQILQSVLPSSPDRRWPTLDGLTERPGFISRDLWKSIQANHGYREDSLANFEERVYASEVEEKIKEAAKGVVFNDEEIKKDPNHFFGEVFDSKRANDPNFLNVKINSLASELYVQTKLAEGAAGELPENEKRAFLVNAFQSDPNKKGYEEIIKGAIADERIKFYVDKVLYADEPQFITGIAPRKTPNDPAEPVLENRTKLTSAFSKEEFKEWLLGEGAYVGVSEEKVGSPIYMRAKDRYTKDGEVSYKALASLIALEPFNSNESYGNKNLSDLIKSKVHGQFLDLVSDSLYRPGQFDSGKSLEDVLAKRALYLNKNERVVKNNLTMDFANIRGEIGTSDVEQLAGSRASFSNQLKSFYQGTYKEPSIKEEISPSPSVPRVSLALAERMRAGGFSEEDIGAGGAKYSKQAVEAVKLFNFEPSSTLATPLPSKTISKSGPDKKGV